ncbi:hypothetical protein [Pseudomonas neuropathica]|uniref:hypothetical protein n=1 Tax=Pseudomonas neuropathica TaxID=2730425 RepID=UPI003EB720B2
MAKIKPSTLLYFLSLNPDHGLERQPLFWLTIAIPVLLAILLGLPLWITHSFEFTETGYATFLRISKLPIGVISLAIPLGVLIGKLHGAKQVAVQIENTRRQIKNTERDNNTKLYISHFEHFCKNVDFIEHSLKTRYSELLIDDTAPIINKPELYRKYYPESSIHVGVMPRSEEFKEITRTRLKQLQDSFKKLMQLENDYNIEEGIEALRMVEHILLLVQADTAYCFNKTKSIFKKSQTIREDLKKTFYYGINQQGKDYKYQTSFLTTLIGEIDSIETLNPDKNIASDLFNNWRTFYKPSYSEHDEIEKRINEILPHTKNQPSDDIPN